MSSHTSPTCPAEKVLHQRRAGVLPALHAGRLDLHALLAAPSHSGETQGPAACVPPGYSLDILSLSSHADEWCAEASAGEILPVPKSSWDPIPEADGGWQNGALSSSSSGLQGGAQADRRRRSPSTSSSGSSPDKDDEAPPPPGQAAAPLAMVPAGPGEMDIDASALAASALAAVAPAPPVRPNAWFPLENSRLGSGQQRALVSTGAWLSRADGDVPHGCSFGCGAPTESDDATIRPHLRRQRPASACI